MDLQTIQTYDKLAEEYDQETTDFWERFPRTFFDMFRRLVHGRVLDVGSGPGRDGLILKQSGIEVVCIDASEAMVKISNQKGLESVLGDFLEMPFEDNSFDAVWAYTSLLHIPKSKIDDAFKEIKRVLKGNGIFGLGLIEGDVEEYRESAGVKMPRLFSFYTQEEIEKLFSIHGFEVLHFETFVPRNKKYLNFIARRN